MLNARGLLAVDRRDGRVFYGPGTDRSLPVAAAVLDMEDPAQPDAPNPEQRRRRTAFYLRNGFRETGIGRNYGPVAMTMLLFGDDTFTQADYDTLTDELFRLWKPPKS